MKSCYCAALESLSSLLSDDIEVIRVHREQLLSELINLYDTKPGIVYHRVKVQFIDEPGDDLVG